MASGSIIAVRHEAQSWNDRSPAPILVGAEPLGRSVGWMQARSEIAAPERYGCGAMQAAKKPGLAEEPHGEETKERKTFGK